MDDCNILWDNTYSIDQFDRMLNSLHPKLEFTKDANDSAQPFLDLLMKRDGDRITLDVYNKPTDTFNYLPFKSCHPRKTKTNIPFTLARRICMIVQDSNTRNERFKELENRLMVKGYPSHIIKWQKDICCERKLFLL